MSPPALLMLALAALAAHGETPDEAGHDDPLAVLDEPVPEAQADPLDALFAPDGDGDAPEADTRQVIEPPPPVDTVEAARRQWQQGELQNALIGVRAVLRQDRFDQEALLLFAELKLARYNAAAAEDILRRALDANTPPERVLVPLAKALNLRGRHQQVLDEIGPVPDMDAPVRAQLLAEQARALVALGRDRDAAARLDEAAALALDEPTVHVGKAVLALRRGFPEQARELLDTALLKAPDHYDAWLLLGQIERDLGNREAAEIAFSEAIARSPNKWMAAYWRALTRLERGDAAGVARDIALAEHQFPAFAGLAYIRARLHLLLERPREAMTELEAYLGIVPQDADALFYAALAANQLRNREQALEHLRRLEQQEGTSTRLLWLKAKTFLAAGDFGAAGRLLQDSAPAEAPVELLLLRQEVLLRQGNTDAAIGLLDEALAARPDSRDLMVARARLRFETGEVGTAVATARRLLARDPYDVDGRLMLAQAELLEGQARTETIQQLRLVQVRAPDDLRIPTLRAELRALRGETGLACAALVDALRIDPASGSVLSRLQRLRCAAVDPDLMQAAYRELLHSHPDASQALPALLALSSDGRDSDAGVDRLAGAVAAAPDNVQLRSALVDALLRLRRVDAAWDVVDATPLAQVRHPLMLRAQGVVALALGRPRSAVGAFQDWLATQPDTAEAAYLLAEALARNGEPGAARAQLLEGWRRDPGHPLAAPVVARLFSADTSADARRRLIEDLRRYFPDSPLIEPLRAQTLMDAGRPDKAAELFAAMRARQPDNPRLFARLLRAKVMAGQREEVIALAEPWMAEHPDDVRTALTLGDLYAEQGRAEKAADWYRRVLELQPDNLFALNNLAVILTSTEPGAAVTLAARAYAIAPKEPQVMDSYGAALLAAGQVAKARKLLTEAYGYGRSDPGIGLNLARALAAAGDDEAARRVLGPLLRQAFPERQKAEALMQRLSSR